MTKSAFAWSTGHALNIYSNPTTPLAIHALKEESDVLPVSPEKVDSAFFEGKYFSSVSQLQYGDRIKISFDINRLYQKDFVLIKGLLEFHRLPDFAFSYNRQHGSLDVTTASSRQNELNKFLKKVSVWIDQEFSFKRQLKEMISFEREYQKKLAKVYAGGEGYTLGRIS
ncbi:MAG: hypothetical protein QM762_17220 [Chryseolinea sp.]